MKYFSVMLIVVAASTIFPSCGFKKEKTTVVPPVKVEVMSVGGIAGSDSQTYSGTVEGGDGAEMSFSVAGTLKGIYVKPGQKVSKGQLLAEIDASNLQNACQVAEATLAQAQDAYNRMKKLHDANALPDIQWVDIQSKLRQAENAVAIARRAVSDARIYSPIAGVVSEKFAEVGQNVAPGVPVMNIVTTDQVKVSISVPESEISAMTPGRKATVTARSVETAPVEGTLTEQGVVANPLSRTYDVKFSVSNASGVLRPGMLCDVKVDVPVASEKATVKVVVPVNAVLLTADNRHFVWLAKNGVAQQRFVETGAITPQGVEIDGGLAAGDSLVVAGMQKICNGTKIQY